MIEGHGDDSFRYATRICHNFSTNICTDVDHSALIAHLAARAQSIKSYPEPSPESTEAIIAAKLGVDKECVMVTNGATEAIYLIAQLLRGGRAAIVVPTFREYQDACRINGHEVVFVRALSEIPEDASSVWLCNPNNPTGKTVGRSLILDAVASHPSAVFIVDQAYCDYAVATLITYAEAVSHPNLLLLNSLTKRFAIPGLRIGYATGHGGLLRKVRALRMPWSVNQLAIEASGFLLGNEDRYVIDAAALHSEAMRLRDSLGEAGIVTSETDCNFFLSRLPEGNASELKEFLIGNYGILIRDASNFEGLDSRYFRIAAQNRDENDLLIKAIKEWMQH